MVLCFSIELQALPTKYFLIMSYYRVKLRVLKGYLTFGKIVISYEYYNTAKLAIILMIKTTVYE